MSKLSRRALLAAGAVGATVDAIPFPVWFRQQAWADVPRVRYNAESPEGQAMLQKYQAGVNRMMNQTAESSPLSWTFQWYTHWVKEPPGEAAELARIYPQPNAQYRALAQQMWETCQAHGGGENEDFFLPWHRMYVYFFELIVRQASYEPSFTLPYWNYSNPAQRALPPEFRVAASPLFRPSRNSGVNTGAAIPASYVALDALKENVYGTNGADQGFNATLDFGLHGNVHVWIGNQQGMGAVPWAANDPIFWMHHCNIDRLWASWNRHGCRNPTTASWLNQQFTFADIHGTKVVATVKDFADIAKLHYTYQEYEPVPAVCRRPIIRLNPLILATLSTRLQIAAAPTRALMVPPPPRPRTRALVLQDHVRTLAADRSVFLVLKDVHADAPPGVHYDVYLDLPDGAAPNHDLPNFVGTMNFFSATMMRDRMGAMKGRTFSYDVTAAVKALQAKGALAATPAVTLVPQGTPDNGANPSIGQIQLVSQ